MAKKNSTPAKQESYIDKLQYDQKLDYSWPNRYFSNVRLMVLLLLSVAFLGFSAMFTLPKTLTPKVDIPFFVISTVLPGASPADIESQITKPIEEELKKIKAIDTYSSASQENLSLLTIEFVPETDPDKARSDLQTAVDSASTKLPEDASEPILKQIDFEDSPVWVFALKSRNSQQDLVSLMRLSKKLKDEIEDLAEVGRVEISGYDDQEIHVVITPEKIKEKNINVVGVMQSIERALKSYPAGQVITSTSAYSVSIDQAATTIDDLRNIPITADNQNYKLSELADVYQESLPNQPQSFYKENGQEIESVVVFSVYKNSDGRIDDARNSTKQKVDEIVSPYQETFEVVSINDYAQEIDDQLLNLGSNFLQTLALVFVSMFLLYGARQSLIAALAIPFTLLATFFSMQVFGFTLNFLSIYSLLIGLGLFTDNAVVIIEGFTSIYKSGKFTAKQAALLTWKDYSAELFSINLLTVWSFLPLLTMKGIVGEFIKPLPIIVSVSMMASVTIALLFTLPSMMILVGGRLAKRVKVLLAIITGLLLLISAAILLPRSPLYYPSLAAFVALFAVVVVVRRELATKVRLVVKSNGHSNRFGKFLIRAFNRGFINLDWLTGYYRRVISKVLASSKRRKTVLITIGIFTVFSYLLLPLGYVKNEFFPKTDSDRLYISLELPVGTNQNITSEKAKDLLADISQNPDVKFITAEVAQGYSDGFSLTQPDSNNVLLTLFLVDEKHRDSSLEIAKKLSQQFANYTHGKLSVMSDNSGGPPAGSDLDISISGKELLVLQQKATEVEAFLNQLPGVENVDKSVKNGKSKISFIPDKTALLSKGLDESQLGFWLRTFVNGVDVKSANLNDEDINIAIRVDSQMIGPESLSLIEIPKNGHYLPITELGKFELSNNPNVINHKNGQRIITITASAQANYIPAQLNQKLVEFAEQELNLDNGYSWAIGGSNQENDQANQSILQAMVISAILILATMVIQLGSFRKALIVMLVIPLAISGVFIFFALSNTPLSLPAMMGVLSLFGIVIANSLMIVDKIGKNLEVGFQLKEAIPEAATSRIEPILLTSAAQIIGLIPATLADAMWRGFGGAIIAGLSFSGIIMLFFIPVVYYYFFPTQVAGTDEKLSTSPRVS
ncbi:MAG: efflux RND transporter permease subunit [Patescibacteria group bacterium]